MAATTKTLDANIEEAKSILASAQKVTVLTGAGVSAESGVPTFRASDGLWEGHRIEDVATPDGFRRNPSLVWDFYNQRRANIRTVQPNPGHLALARMEQHWGENFTLVTQNVDTLHFTAGNRRVLEVHGSLRRTRCTRCGAIEDRGLEPLDALPNCPDCGGLLRPDIVWFNEALPEAIWESALLAAATCDVFLLVGTSAVVHPAAGLVQVAKLPMSRHHSASMATVIEINVVPSEASHLADLGLYGPSGQLLPKIWPH